MQIENSRAMGSLMLGSDARNDGTRCLARKPRCRQPLRDIRVILSRHVNDKSRSARDKLAPDILFSGISFGAMFLGGLMGRDEHQRRRSSTMSQRNLNGSGRAHGRRDPRNYLERNVVSGQRFDLFSRASENQWIATLQPDNAQPRSRQCDHQIIDFPLQDFLFPAALANVVNLSGGRNQLQYLGRDQVVVQNRFGALQKPKSLQCQQLGIARSRAYQIDFSFQAPTPFDFISSYSSSCSTPVIWPAPLRMLPCSPMSAVTPTWSLYRDRWPERVVWSLRAAQPMPCILLRTDVPVAAEVSEPAMDSAQRLKSRSAGRRAAPLRDKRNRKGPEHPPPCTALRSAAPQRTYVRCDSVSRLQPR